MGQLINSEFYHLFLFLFVLFIIFWIYCVIWVARDISRRTNSLHFQIVSIVTIVILTPLFGLPIYFMIRPVQRFDTRGKLPSGAEFNIICGSCGSENERGFEFCAYCGDEVTQKCSGCMTLLPFDYFYCPFCGNKLGTQ